MLTQDRHLIADSSSCIRKLTADRSGSTHRHIGLVTWISGIRLSTWPQMNKFATELLWSARTSETAQLVGERFDVPSARRLVELYEEVCSR
jgi:hypothetical protein